MVIIRVERLSKQFYHPLRAKSLWFMIILTFGIGLLLYQLYITSSRTSIIEGLETDQSQLSTDSSSSNPIPTTDDIFVRNLGGSLFKLDIFKNIFNKKCLAGCISPTEKSTTGCKKSSIGRSKKTFYKCPWVCNIDTFNQNIKDDPLYAQQYANAGATVQQCSPDHENIDCGGCVPEKYFPDNTFKSFI
jgi:hypothetical protein